MASKLKKCDDVDKNVIVVFVGAPQGGGQTAILCFALKFDPVRAVIAQ